MKIESVCSFMSSIYSSQHLIVSGSHWYRLWFKYSWGWRCSMYLCLFWCKKCAANDSDILGICSFYLHVSFNFILIQNDAFHNIFWLLIIMWEQLSLINSKVLIKFLSTFCSANSWTFLYCMLRKQNRLVHNVWSRRLKRSNI